MKKVEIASSKNEDKIWCFFSWFTKNSWKNMLHILFVQCHWTKYPSPSLTAWLQQYEVLRSYYFFFTSSSNSSYWIQRPQKREVKNPRFFPVNYLLPFFFFICSFCLQGETLIPFQKWGEISKGSLFWQSSLISYITWVMGPLLIN